MNAQSIPLLNRAAIRKGKRLIVAAVGATVLALGLVLMVLPGPAFIVIPAGLAILAMEFAWARRWLRKARGLLPGNSSPAKPETLSSLPTSYHRDKAAASCRNAIPSRQTETAYPSKSDS